MVLWKKIMLGIDIAIVIIIILLEVIVIRNYKNRKVNFEN